MIDTVRDKLRRFFDRRRHAYQATFRGGYAHIVLEDLAKFCRANEPTYQQDARAHALAEGRREVWLRIQRHLRLSDDELWALSTGQPSGPVARVVQMKDEDVAQ
jgi:hypothetical protein